MEKIHRRERKSEEERGDVTSVLIVATAFGDIAHKLTWTKISILVV